MVAEREIRKRPNFVRLLVGAVFSSVRRVIFARKTTAVMVPTKIFVGCTQKATVKARSEAAIQRPKCSGNRTAANAK